MKTHEKAMKHNKEAMAPIDIQGKAMQVNARHQKTLAYQQM